MSDPLFAGQFASFMAGIVTGLAFALAASFRWH